MRWLTGFGRFWYGFIVGDSVVLAVGGPAALIVGFAATKATGDGPAQVLLPLVIVATLAISLRRSRY